jgi:hypothetical protein
MTRYDSAQYTPPAPVASVVIQHPDTGEKALNVPMQVDSGADVTLLPAATIEQLGLVLGTDTSYELEAYDGGAKIVDHAATAVVKIENLRFKGQYLITDRAIGVLGRNILNHVIIELNGPSLTWTMRKS